jgi:hypothetical protein
MTTNEVEKLLNRVEGTLSGFHRIGKRLFGK